MSEYSFTFSEEDVDSWCQENNHTASESTFNEKVVPNMMLLDKVSGMLSSLGEEDEEVILSGVTAARFRDPVLLDEEVRFSLSEIEENENFTAIDFEARVEERGSLVAHGSLSVTIN